MVGAAYRLGLVGLIAMAVCPGAVAQLSDAFAAVQYSPGPSPRRNRAALLRSIERAAGSGHHFIVLPELAITGPLLAREAGESISSPTIAVFAAAARRHHLWLAVPLVERAQDGYHVSTALLAPDGQLAAIYRKRTPRPDGSDGPRLVRSDPAAPLDTVDVGGFRIGILSGDDLRLGVPRLAERGAHAILIAAGWQRGESAAWRELCSRLSRENVVALVVASRGGAGGVYLPGGSFIEPRFGIVEAMLERPPERVPAPLGLPSVPLPAGAPFNPALVELGRALFFEAGLSSDGNVSCASCHQPDRAFASGGRFGTGVGGRLSRRNVPTLLNVAYRESLFWDGSSSSLERVVKFPMSHAAEMNFHYLDAVSWLRQQPFYSTQFRESFGDRPIEFDDVALALASYQRSLISGDSAFDRYRFGGQPDALDAAARRGLSLFTGKGRCVACHVIASRFALFTDQEAHNTGVGYAGGFADLGRGALDEGADKSGFFVTPSLRNVALTAPYMHDGSLATLADVVDFYDRGGGTNPLLDRRVKALGLTPQERSDLVEFLRSLTGTPPALIGTRYAAISFQPIPGAIEENRRELARHAREAVARGAHVVVLPEFADSGPLASVPTSSYPRLALDEATGWLAPLARSLRCWLVATALEPLGSGRFRQVAVMLDESGTLVAVSPKISHWAPWGDGETAAGYLKELQTVPTPFGRVGLLSGDDLAEGISRLADLGARTILVPASWEASDVTDWRALAQEAAWRHRVDLVIANLGPSHPSVTREGKVLPDSAGPVAVASFGPVDGGLASPLGLPPVPVPTTANTSADCIALGRELFHDPGLSRDGAVSCATCHHPDRDFSDGKRVGVGVFERPGRFNVPSLLNVGYRTHLFWDGRADTLEAQFAHALLGWSEMDSSLETVARRLGTNPRYRSLLDRMRAGDKLETAARCIAAFERTLLAADSPFDRFYYGGDAAAIGEPARRGFHLFRGKANCNRCHLVNDRWSLFTDNLSHNTGIGYQPRFEYLGYAGDGLEGNPATRNVFRGEYVTPGLRNVARTKPYMHDGSLATIDDVIAFYERGGNPNPHLDPRLRPLQLTPDERQDLIEFLQSLTSSGGSAEVSSQ